MRYLRWISNICSLRHCLCVSVSQRQAACFASGVILQAAPLSYRLFISLSGPAPYFWHWPGPQQDATIFNSQWLHGRGSFCLNPALTSFSPEQKAIFHKAATFTIITALLSADISQAVALQLSSPMK